MMFNFIAYSVTHCLGVCFRDTLLLMISGFRNNYFVDHLKAPFHCCRVSKYPGYPTNGKIRHPARLLKPHHRAPCKTDLPKALTACQSLEARTTNSIPPEPCGKVSGEIGASGDISPSRPSPHNIIKVPDPLGLLPPCSRDTCNPLGKTVSHGNPPTAALAPTDGTYVIVHSQEEHGSHALTKCDPGHSTTTTSILLQ
jgi:hypothetical protein